MGLMGMVQSVGLMDGAAVVASVGLRSTSKTRWVGGVGRRPALCFAKSQLVGWRSCERGGSHTNRPLQQPSRAMDLDKARRDPEAGSRPAFRKRAGRHGQQRLRKP